MCIRDRGGVFEQIRRGTIIYFTILYILLGGDVLGEIRRGTVMYFTLRNAVYKLHEERLFFLLQEERSVHSNYSYTAKQGETSSVIEMREIRNSRILN